MKRCAVALLVLSLAAVVFGGVAQRAQADINLDNVQLCFNGGWRHLVRANGTPFSSQFACQQYAVFGGVPRPPCTAGSDNFSDDAAFSVPTTFAGGTIDGPYGGTGLGPVGIRIKPQSWNGTFPDGTHVLYTGTTTTPFRLSFADAVSSVQLDATSNHFVAFTLTLKGYDSSNAVVDTDAATQTVGVPLTLSVSSATNNIKYFTIETGDTGGLAFTNIVWDCA